MADTKTTRRTQGPWYALRGDINGLFIVLAVLIALLLLPGPSEAEYKRSDMLMNDIVQTSDFRAAPSEVPPKAR